MYIILCVWLIVYINKIKEFIMLNLICIIIDIFIDEIFFSIFNFDFFFNFFLYVCKL